MEWKRIEEIYESIPMYLLCLSQRVKCERERKIKVMGKDRKKTLTWLMLQEEVKSGNNVVITKATLRLSDCIHCLLMGC